MYDLINMMGWSYASYVHHLYSTCGLQDPALRPKAHRTILSHRQWSVDPCLMRVTSHADNRDLKTFTFTHYIVLPGNLGKPWKAQPGAPRERQLTHNTDSPMSWNHNGLGIEYQHISTAPCRHAPIPILVHRLQNFRTPCSKTVPKRGSSSIKWQKHSKNAALARFLALPANLSGQHFSSQRPRPPKLEGIV